MGRSTLCLIIAYISAIFHFLVVVGCTCYIVTLKRAIKVYNVPKYDYSPYHFRTHEFEMEVKTSLVTFGLVVLAITLIISIVLLIVSIYLILGIKRERHQYMAPWVYSTAIAIVINVIKVIAHSKDQLFFNIIVIIIPIALWYPVYSLYRELRNAPANSSHIVVASPYPATQITINPQMHPTATPANYYTPPNAGNYPPQTYAPQAYPQQPQAYPPPYSNATDGNYNPPSNPYYTN